MAPLPARAAPGTAAPTALRALVLLLAFAGLAALPPWLGPARLGAAVEIADMLALAILWNLLAGYAGIVSIGQQAFVGLGGYALFALVVLAGVPPLAGIAAALAALPTALLLFRLRGPQFAIGSWVVAEVFRYVFAGFGAWYMISLGALAMFVMLVAPGGICGALARRGVVLFPTERRLGVRATAGADARQADKSPRHAGTPARPSETP